MSSNKEKYIEEVVQEVLNLQYMNDIMIFPPLMKKIVQNLFEHRVFNSNVNNNNL